MRFNANLLLSFFSIFLVKSMINERESHSESDIPVIAVIVEVRVRHV